MNKRNFLKCLIGSSAIASVGSVESASTYTYRFTSSDDIITIDPDKVAEIVREYDSEPVLIRAVQLGECRKEWWRDKHGVIMKTRVGDRIYEERQTASITDIFG